MGVLRSVHLYWPVVVGKGSIPMRANRRGHRLTQQAAFAGGTARGKGVQSLVWEVGVTHKALACGIWIRMPSGEVADPTPGARVHMDGLHATRPVDKGQLQGAGYPAFVGDPLLVAFALVQAFMAMPIDAANPQAIGHRARIKNQCWVVGAKLGVANDVIVKRLVGGLLWQVDEQHGRSTRAPQRDGPGAVVTRQGGGAHGSAHHPLNPVGLLGKGEQQFFLQARHVQAVGAALGGEQQMATIAGGVQ